MLARKSICAEDFGRRCASWRVWKQHVLHIKGGVGKPVPRFPKLFALGAKNVSLMVQQVRVGAPYFENLDTSASQNRMFAVSPFPTLLSVLLLSLLILWQALSTWPVNSSRKTTTLEVTEITGDIRESTLLPQIKMISWWAECYKREGKRTRKDIRTQQTLL